MSDQTAALSARDLLEGILRPHTELAVDLLSMVRTQSTGDSSYRFQVAGLIIFLSGVDKALSLALQLLYLTGRVEWNWLARRKLQAGEIECHPGLTAKLKKLEGLGLGLSEFEWLVGLRNWYLHDCSIYAGYTVGIDSGDNPSLILRAHGPEVSHSDPPLTALSGDAIEAYANGLRDRLGEFLDRNGWQAAWASVQERLAKLPQNPAPEYSEVAAGLDPAVVERCIAALNEKHVGEGLSKLLKCPSTPTSKSRELRGTGRPVALRELYEQKCRSLPKGPGIYVVRTPEDLKPEFVPHGTGGRFKGKNPNIALEMLRARWIDSARELYIGKADNLRARVWKFLRFGHRHPVDHWGGRLIWQIKQTDDLLLDWYEHERPTEEETRLLEAFKEKYRRLPFANLRT